MTNMDFRKSVMDNCRGRYRVEWWLPCLINMGLDPEMRVQAFDTFAAAANKFMRVKALGTYSVCMYDRNGERCWKFNPPEDDLNKYESEV